MGSGEFVTYATASGDLVQVEIEPSDGFRPVNSERPLGEVDEVFRSVFFAADALMRQAREVRADEITLRFGIKITGSGNAVVSRTANEGTFEVSLSWNRGSDA